MGHLNLYSSLVFNLCLNLLLLLPSPARSDVPNRAYLWYGIVAHDYYHIVSVHFTNCTYHRITVQ